VAALAEGGPVVLLVAVRGVALAELVAGVVGALLAVLTHLLLVWEALAPLFVPVVEVPFVSLELFVIVEFVILLLEGFRDFLAGRGDGLRAGKLLVSLDFLRLQTNGGCEHLEEPLDELLRLLVEKHAEIWHEFGARRIVFDADSENVVVDFGEGVVALQIPAERGNLRAAVLLQLRIFLQNLRNIHFWRLTKLHTTW
jgi:hypothetical protein